MDAARKPLIGLPACVRQVDDQDFHIVGDKYLLAVARAAGGIPVTFPALAQSEDFSEMIQRLDGFLVTGSPSNVEPHHYGGPASADGTRHDTDRDATTLPFIRAALDAGLPTLAICRGLQELNVALGGTLHQRIQDLPGRLDHRARPEDPIEIRYGPAHPVSLAPDGILARIAPGLGPSLEIEVNSLHSQGIDQLAPGLAVEATAPDGIVEAVRVEAARSFALGVQWHPEWQFQDDAFSMALFAAFGAAAGERAMRRNDSAHRAA